MTTVSRTVARATLGAMLVLALAVPASAQNRHRVVKRPAGAAATLSGIVVDAITRAPVPDASIKTANRTARTGADGRFTFEGLTANTFTLQTTRWGYLGVTQDVALSAGANQIEIALQPAPIVTVKAKSGTTYPLDFDSVQFGYVVAFVGWRSGPELHLCLPSGEQSNVPTTSMKSVTFPGVRTESTSCCSLVPGAIARITLQDGTVVDGTIKESCSSSVFYVRGRNRTTGEFEAIKLTDVEIVNF